MEHDNCDQLFEYLRSILYDRHIQTLDIESLDESYRKLGQGLKVLQKAVEELLAFSADISQGNLSGPCPSRDNFLCVNMKNLHANLNHLTWQAKQVAAGDYSQHVSYLGEFSEAFNTMTAQLKEREALLKEEAEIARKRAAVIEEYNELLVEMTRKRNEWILVVDADTRDITYCNKRKDEIRIDPAFCEICNNRFFFRNSILNWQDSEQYKIWEIGDEDHGFYRITTFSIEWAGHNAFAHIVVDITNEKMTENRLASKAYYDSGTGIRNRLFFEEYMEAHLNKKSDITLCYLDLDGLKFVNDQFGHNEGDCYIRRFVSVIENSFRSSDVFARIGGDEFCVILPNNDRDAVERRFAEVLEQFVAENDKEYPVSFSYGVVQIDGTNSNLTMDGIIREADAAMYQCKKNNKEKYHKA